VRTEITSHLLQLNSQNQNSFTDSSRHSTTTKETTTKESSSTTTTKATQQQQKKVLLIAFGWISHTSTHDFIHKLKQGSYPWSEAIFQDFSRTQIHFSRAPKCTIIEAINPYEIEIQK